MASEQEFPVIFGRLKAILEPYADDVVVETNKEGRYSLNTRHIMKNKQPLFFASTQIRKSYVSFYLMPVYAFPDLLDDIGDLRKWMQGKSCFNFKKLDKSQTVQLTELTRTGYERYRKEGVLS